MIPILPHDPILEIRTPEDTLRSLPHWKDHPAQDLHPKIVMRRERPSLSPSLDRGIFPVGVDTMISHTAVILLSISPSRGGGFFGIVVVAMTIRAIVMNRDRDDSLAPEAFVASDRWRGKKGWIFTPQASRTKPIFWGGVRVVPKITV